MAGHCGCRLHNCPATFIAFSMKVYNGLALNFQQLWDTYKKDKVILILCYGLFAVALGITFAFYRQIMASWLYSDRFQYLYGIIFERKLFSLLFTYIWKTLLLYFVALLLACNRYTRFLCLLLPVACGVSCGVYFAVAFSSFGVLGVIAGIAVILVEQLLNVTVVIIAFNECGCCQCCCFTDILLRYKLTQLASVLAVIAKCIANFVILSLFIALF